MKIEHIALYVNDLEGARDFFARYFGGQPGGLYHNKTTGFRSYFLTFAEGARLELMTRPGLAAPEKQPLQTGYIHLAFSAGSRETVDALTARLAADGWPAVSGPRVTGDGYYESCVAGFEGNLIEITV